MSGLKCSRCGFYMDQRNAFCPDCGRFLLPHPPESTAHLLVAVVLFAAVYLYGAIVGLSQKGGEEFKPILCFTLLTAAAGFYALAATLLKRWSHSAQSRSLRGRQLRIRRKLDELLNKDRNIAQMMAAPACGKTLSALASDTLARAHESAGHLIHEYEARLREIQVIRFLNRIENLYMSARMESPAQCSASLTTIQDLESELTQQIQLWSAEVSAQSCLENLRKAIRLVESLKEALIARQVHHAVKDISPLHACIDEPLPIAISSDLTTAHHLDMLSVELRKLEGENIRLQSEQEVAESASTLR